MRLFKEAKALGLVVETSPPESPQGERRVGGDTLMHTPRDHQGETEFNSFNESKVWQHKRNAGMAEQAVSCVYGCLS